MRTYAMEYTLNGESRYTVFMCINYKLAFEIADKIMDGIGGTSIYVESVFGSDGGITHEAGFVSLKELRS